MRAFLIAALTLTTVSAYATDIDAMTAMPSLSWFNWL
ncbi:MAG: hypothetical protein GAK35_00413 [Herbaspirillum frisingense]|uniref:Conjugal transfer protein TraF n=1 Tax=Herbaspirillum frisingense TaxID=92645 RepID=A0A7V8JVP1_9BURK|nr:MAG: hypothetical protein GAK35_00413 [Herbaspirillum frisingense]